MRGPGVITPLKVVLKKKLIRLLFFSALIGLIFQMVFFDYGSLCGAHFFFACQFSIFLLFTSFHCSSKDTFFTFLTSANLIRLEHYMMFVSKNCLIV